MSENELKRAKPVDLVMLHPDGETEIHVAAHLVADCVARGFRPLGTVTDYEAYQARLANEVVSEPEAPVRVEIEPDPPQGEPAEAKPAKPATEKAAKDEKPAK